jgi:hypothetical protein
MPGKIFHFRRRGAGVGGDGDGAEFDAGEPGQHGLDAIVEMDQKIFTRLDAARRKTGRERADTVVKFAVGPDSRRRIERRPDQKGMIAAGSRPHLQEPRHVHSGERPDHARRCLGIRHCSSPWPGRLRYFLAAFLPPDGTAGKSSIAGTVLSTSLRANGSSECAPDDKLREAIHSFFAPRDGLLRFARNDGERATHPPHTTKSRSNCRRDPGSTPIAALRGRPAF